MYMMGNINEKFLKSVKLDRNIALIVDVYDLLDWLLEYKNLVSFEGYY